MPVTKNTQNEMQEFLEAKTNVEEIVQKFAHTQNSFINEDGTNGYDEMLEQLAILVTVFQNRVKREMRILDDKGKEHKEGEIFESETIKIEI